MRYAVLFIAFFLVFTGSSLAWAGPGNANQEPVQEIVITLEDLDTYTSAMLRIFALSNEVSLRAAAKREDLRELHGEFVSRVAAILNAHNLTIPRYNEIERSSQLAPKIMAAVSERVVSSDERLQQLAKIPKTMADARRLLRGKVDYPINGETMPWFADEKEVEGMAENYISGPNGLPQKGMFPGLGSMPKF